MYSKFFLFLLIVVVLVSCSGPGVSTAKNQALTGINITIDPGHGNTTAYDDFRIGPTGEREEWINLRVARLLAKKLSGAGANVIMTRRSDSDISLGGRAVLAKKHGSHLFVSIHHNGSLNDPGIDLPIVYFFGEASMNPASVDFARILLKEMETIMDFEQPESGAVYSDHLIYSSGTSVLRNTVDHMPGVIGEGGFFTHPDGEMRLRSSAYNKLEALVYFNAILQYFERGLPSAYPIHLDTLTYVEPGQVIEFQLLDGFDGFQFMDSSLSAMQDDIHIQSAWEPSTGILSVQTEPTEDKTISIRIFGRNVRGNALHPIPFDFLTLTGERWHSHEIWSDAFNAGQVVYEKLLSNTMLTSNVDMIEEALHLFQLSLELQPVHPEAIAAEKAILNLLILKQELLEEDLGDEIDEQNKKILEFYPE